MKMEDKQFLFTIYFMTIVTFISIFLGATEQFKILAIFLTSLMSLTVLSMLYFMTKAIINGERDIMHY